MFVTTMTLVLLKYVQFDYLFLDLNILGWRDNNICHGCGGELLASCVPIACCL